MDRMYLAPHQVSVYPTAESRARNEKPVKTVSAVPWPHAGYDNYRIDGVMYPAFQDRNTQEVYVLLDTPFFPKP